MTAAESGDVAEPAARLSGPAVARAAPAQVPAVRDGAAARDADAAVTDLYAAHYRTLVGLATLLLRNRATAEEVVQDAFVAMHGRWRRLRDTNQALGYLRRSVINGSRSVLRHQAVVVRAGTTPPPPDAPSAEHDALTLLEHAAMVAALDRLPLRQREALVLRFYADMSSAQIAAAMGIGASAVKGHTARGLSSLRSMLEAQA